MYDFIQLSGNAILLSTFVINRVKQSRNNVKKEDQWTAWLAGWLADCQVIAIGVHSSQENIEIRSIFNYSR